MASWEETAAAKGLLMLKKAACEEWEAAGALAQIHEEVNRLIDLAERADQMRVPAEARKRTQQGIDFVLFPDEQGDVADSDTLPAPESGTARAAGKSKRKSEPNGQLKTPPNSNEMPTRRTPESDMSEQRRSVTVEAPPLRKRRATDHPSASSEPRRKHPRVSGGKHEQQPREVFGRRAKEWFALREIEIQKDPAKHLVEFQVARRMHRPDGLTGQPDVDELRFAESQYNQTLGRRNLNLYYVRKDLFFEACAIVIEHNLRSLAKDKNFEPVPFHKTVAQYYLKADTNKTSAMIMYYWNRGWLPVLTASPERASGGVLTTDRAKLDRFCAPADRRALYERFKAFDELQYHGNTMCL